MKIFYKTSATATGGCDGRTQVDDGSIGFDLVSFQNDGTGADEKHQRAEYGKHRRTDEKRPHGMGEKLIYWADRVVSCIEEASRRFVRYSNARIIHIIDIIV